MTLQDWLPEGATLLIAGVAGVFGYGKLSARMNAVEERSGKLEAAVEKMGTMNVAIATIEERTKNTDESVKGQAGDLRRLTDHLLDEGRSFARRIVQQDQGRSRARPSA